MEEEEEEVAAEADRPPDHRHRHRAALPVGHQAAPRPHRDRRPVPADRLRAVPRIAPLQLRAQPAPVPVSALCGVPRTGLAIVRKAKRAVRVVPPRSLQRPPPAVPAPAAWDRPRLA